MARFTSALAAVCLLALLCAPAVSAASSRRGLSQSKTSSTAHSKNKGKSESERFGNILRHESSITLCEMAALDTRFKRRRRSLV